YWIFLAYLFHTIGELSASPVALSFITKLSPLKYSSIMMGLFFAATGFGDKLAGSIGSMSQLVPYEMEVQYDKEQLTKLMTKDSIRTKDENNKIITVYDYPISIDLAFEVKTKVYLDDGKVIFKEYESDNNITDAFKLDQESYT